MRSTNDGERSRRERRGASGLAGLTLLTLLLPAAAGAGPVPPSPASGGGPTPTVQPAVEPTRRPLLWQVKGPRAQAPSYLFGTIHVPDPRVTTLPEVVQRALDGADGVYTELPMTLTTTLAAAMQMMLPLGQTLDQLVPAELLQQAERLLERNDLSLVVFGRMKIWVLAVTLGMADLMPQMKDGTPLDQALYRRAERQAKEVGGLETVEEQVGAFDGLSQEEQIELLRQSIKETQGAAGRPVSPNEELVRLYLAGDEEALFRKAMAPSAKGSPLEAKLYRMLVVERNARMTERIAKRMTEHPARSYLFAVGAGHFAGKDSVLRQLRAQGWTVRRLGPQDAATLPPPRTSPAPPPATAPAGVEGTTR